MSTIAIDTKDDVKVLRACRNMLSELIGDAPVVTTRIPKEATAEVEVGDTVVVDAESGEVSNVTTSTADTTVSTEVDPHGVVFNAEFCGKAKQPFYASGARKGQWKKRQGVAEEAYDAWYASQPKADAGQGATTSEEHVNTAGAFGGNANSAPDVQTPTDCGAFMGWVSGKQAAGLLTQEDIGNAYTTAGVQVTDLFPPNDPATVEGHVRALHALLVGKAGA